MGILKGAMTLRRYSVSGEPPDNFRESYMEAFKKKAFYGSSSTTFQGETYGWAQAHNLLDTDFSDINKWFYQRYIIGMLRVDKKQLPAKLFRAHLDQRCDAWCKEHGRENCSPSAKSELKETLTIEMLAKTLPAVRTVEFCWNLLDGWVIFHSTSQSMNDKFLTHFYETFGLKLSLVSPIDFVEEAETVTFMESCGVSNLRGSAL
jgi:DNA recombination-dependent growth factor C